MMTMTRSLAACALAALFLLSARAQSADPPASTITIPRDGLRVVREEGRGKMAEVPGVAKVEYDVKARTIKAGATPSPKALWEVVEKGGKDPSKLDVPGGTFSKKPAN